MYPLPLRPLRQRGFSLPELMVAVAIGLALLAALAGMFVNNTKAQAEMEKTNRQVENGRYAVTLVGTDVRHAGFYGEFDPRILTLPPAMPNPCTIKLDELKEALPLHIQGIDNAAANALDCIKDLKAGTDVIVVRRTGSCTLGAAGCDTVDTGRPYFQASLCNNASELNSVSATDHYAMDLTAANLTRHQHNCTDIAGSGTLAVLRRYKVLIYYVATGDDAGDGIPTLKRAELTADSNTISYTTVSQVNGIENMQLEYGIDTNDDGVPNLFTANPKTYGGCAADDCAMANWRNVMAVKVNFLARNLDQTKGYKDARSYTLGLMADNKPNVIAASNDGYKRHVFQSQISLPNPAGRKAP